MENVKKYQKISFRNVEKYFKGMLVVKYNLETLDISKGINWNYRNKDNERTYQVYLHSLMIIKDFVSSAEYKNNPKYYKEAKKIILNWYRADSKGTQKWNEHAVSTRIKYIIEFQEKDHKYKLSKRIFNKILWEHCNFLSNEKNYKRNNHGLMMDISLIYSSASLDDENIKKIFLEKALYRIRYAFYRDFSRKGVHLENSPEYHKLILTLYHRLKLALQKHGVKLDKDLEQIIQNAINFKEYIIKPDLTYPLIGDTGLINESKINKKYIDFVDYEAGIIIMNKENELNKSYSAYLTFKSGYLSKTHKHLDDLSITYYNFGQDILVDSGKYSYNQQDTIRQYLISPNAHNTIAVKNKLYKLNEPLKDQHKLKVTQYIKEKNYRAVTGINNLYSGISMTRHTILTNNDILFVIDAVSSNNVERFQQNFNLNKDATLEKLNTGKYKIIIEDKKYILETFPIRKQKIKSLVDDGYYSEKFSEVIKNKKVIFETESKQNIFVTALYQEGVINIDNVRLSNKLLSYNCNGKEELVKY